MCRVVVACTRVLRVLLSLLHSLCVCVCVDVCKREKCAANTACFSCSPPVLSTSLHLSLMCVCVCDFKRLQRHVPSCYHHHRHLRCMFLGARVMDLARHPLTVCTRLALLCNQFRGELTQTWRKREREKGIVCSGDGRQNKGSKSREGEGNGGERERKTEAESRERERESFTALPSPHNR